MNAVAELYGRSLALLTDLYQLTMASGYWKNGMAEREAVFHLTFRRNPFGGGYSIACGLQTVIDYVARLRFDDSELDYLARLPGADQRPMFEAGFIEYLARLRFTGQLHAIPEGSLVYPHEPLVRVQGPILQCQVLETPLLNIVNFCTLIATKAARVCWAAENDRVVEFGLRRAQGIDGGVSASRAAFVGGCHATSNVLAGHLFGIPVAGTHAHSWVMAFDDELTAFAAYADALPNNCVFLVDTYDTLQGVRNAVDIGRRLRQQGHEMIGVRLDSGDLAWLSIQARKILDEGGFPGARIVASNDLDERLILSLKQQGAKIDTWGIGTRLVTAYDQPALGGVYKLGALRDENGVWQYRIKLSEQAVKVTTPGVLQVRRFFDGNEYLGDMLFDEQLGVAPETSNVIVDPQDPNRQKQIASSAEFRDLLVPIFRDGELVYSPPMLKDIQQLAAAEMSRLSPSVKRFDHPHTYPVGLEQQLHALKTRLIREARGLTT